MDVSMYDIEKDTVLISMQKGQFVPGVRQFALLQPETLYFEFDSKKSYPEGVDPSDIPDPVPPPPPVKKNSAQKKKAGKKKKKKAKAKTTSGGNNGAQKNEL